MGGIGLPKSHDFQFFLGVRISRPLSLLVPGLVVLVPSLPSMWSFREQRMR